MNDKNSIKHFIRTDSKWIYSLKSNIISAENTILCFRRYCSCFEALWALLATEMFLKRSFCLRGSRFESFQRAVREFPSGIHPRPIEYKAHIDEAWCSNALESQVWDWARPLFDCLSLHRSLRHVYNWKEARRRRGGILGTIQWRMRPWNDIVALNVKAPDPREVHSAFIQDSARELLYTRILL